MAEAVVMAVERVKVIVGAEVGEARTMVEVEVQTKVVVEARTKVVEGEDQKMEEEEARRVEVVEDLPLAVEVEGAGASSAVVAAAALL